MTTKERIESLKQSKEKIEFLLKFGKLSPQQEKGYRQVLHDIYEELMSRQKDQTRPIALKPTWQIKQEIHKKRLAWNELFSEEEVAKAVSLGQTYVSTKGGGRMRTIEAQRRHQEAFGDTVRGDPKLKDDPLLYATGLGQINDAMSRAVVASAGPGPVIATDARITDPELRSLAAKGLNDLPEQLLDAAMFHMGVPLAERKKILRRNSGVGVLNTAWNFGQDFIPGIREFNKVIQTAQTIDELEKKGAYSFVEDHWKQLSPLEKGLSQSEKIARSVYLFTVIRSGLKSGLELKKSLGLKVPEDRARYLKMAALKGVGKIKGATPKLVRTVADSLAQYNQIYQQSKRDITDQVQIHLGKIDARIMGLDSGADFARGIGKEPRSDVRVQNHLDQHPSLNLSVFDVDSVRTGTYGDHNAPFMVGHNIGDYMNENGHPGVAITTSRKGVVTSQMNRARKGPNLTLFTATRPDAILSSNNFTNYVFNNLMNKKLQGVPEKQILEELNEHLEPLTNRAYRTLGEAYRELQEMSMSKRRDFQVKILSSGMLGLSDLASVERELSDPRLIGKRSGTIIAAATVDPDGERKVLPFLYDVSPNVSQKNGMIEYVNPYSHFVPGTYLGNTKSARIIDLIEPKWLEDYRAKLISHYKAKAEARGTMFHPDMIDDDFLENSLRFSMSRYGLTAPLDPKKKSLLVLRRMRANRPFDQRRRTLDA